MRRFNRATDKRDVVEKLLSSNGGAFSQIWQIMIFAACLGVKIKRKEALGDTDSSVAIPPSVLANNCSSWPGLLYLINIVETSDPNILNSDESADESRMRLLEEYANGGLAFMRENLETKEYSLDSVCQLLADEAVATPRVSESI
jgi:dnd system-associated protein 4